MGDAGASAGTARRGRQARCVLFQFPHWFTARRALTDNYRAETFALLEKLGLTYVVVDEPQGLRSSTPPVVAATSPLAMSGDR